MNTAINYRHRAARLLVLYRWKCKFYGEQSRFVVFNAHKHIYMCYMQICALNQIGLISNDCQHRAYSMYAKIRNKYYRGVNNGGIKQNDFRQNSKG